MTIDRALTRRSFLQSTMATGAVLAAGSRLAADDPVAGADPGDIDAHAHVWIDEIARYPLAGKFTPEQLIPRTFPPETMLELAGKNGIRRVVLVQHQVYFGRDNRYLVDTLQSFPGRFSGVAAIDAARPDVTAEMDRLQAGGVRGFRICAGDGGTERWSDSPGMHAMWKHAGEQGLAICPQIHPDLIAETDLFCQRYPETIVVVDHFAKIGHDGEVRENDLAALARLARHRQAHCKISAFYGVGDQQPPYDEIVPIIRRMVDAFGPERLMWGSDCPYQLLFGKNNTYEASIELIRQGTDFLSAADQRWLLRKTAERIFFS